KELRIVQLSDVHLGTIHNKEYLSRIVDKTNKLNPDIVLITGDLFDGGSMLKDDFILPLNGLKAKSFFSMGNHEQYEGIEDVTRILNETNVTILRNEVQKYKGVQIIGIDNPPNEFGGKNDVIQSIKFNKSQPSILMYHPPKSLEEAQQAGVNLQLSGHTHDGQIFPFTLLSMIVYPRVHGLYDYIGTYMYVSPGTGTWGPPLRVGSNSEITLINLVKA
ncbi:MAG: metallophosphoesterase, partial [Candidatus Woesearchaeota archaeon]|nr:metallophosphoesterase [Candidatus Woesearchaeota archaeon]